MTSTDPRPTSLVPDENRRILVVDDDQDALRILCDFLEAKGYNCIAALDGHEALARFYDDGPFDVLVLDVMMPGLDGLEVCRRLKSSPAGQLTPVLLVSARTDSRSRIAGLYGGADDYISKPVDLREFAARVEVLLRVRDRYRQLAERRGDAIDAALLDGMSGLLNSMYFQRRIEEEIARMDRYTGSLTLVVADLVGLPDPSAEDEEESLDRVGDDIFPGPTDRLVRAAGQALRTCLRRQDLLARIRRSRFAILFPETNRRTVQIAIDRLQAAASAVPANPDGDGGPAAGLSLRMGISELDPKMNADTLLAAAEPR